MYTSHAFHIAKRPEIFSVIPSHQDYYKNPPAWEGCRSRRVVVEGDVYVEFVLINNWFEQEAVPHFL